PPALPAATTAADNKPPKEANSPRAPAAPWVNRDLPRAPLRQPWRHSAARAGLPLLTTGTASTALDAERARVHQQLHLTAPCYGWWWRGPGVRDASEGGATIVGMRPWRWGAWGGSPSAA